MSLKIIVMLFRTGSKILGAAHRGGVGLKQLCRMPGLANAGYWCREHPAEGGMATAVLRTAPDFSLNDPGLHRLAIPATRNLAPLGGLKIIKVEWRKSPKRETVKIAVQGRMSIDAIS